MAMANRQCREADSRTGFPSEPGTGAQRRPLGRRPAPDAPRDLRPIILAIVVAAVIFNGCELFLPTSPASELPDRRRPYQATTLPDDISKLFETAGDPDSGTVWIYEQGGPIHELDEVGLTYQEFSIYRGEAAIQFVAVHQTLTINHDLAARYRDLSLADLQAEVDVSVEILHRTIEHFQKQGKRVVVIGHSYGAFLIPRYLWRHGPDGADLWLLMAGRLDMPMEVVNGYLRGTPWYFPDAVKPAPAPVPDEREVTDRDHIAARIAAATGYDRYTERLATTGLNRVVYVYGMKDQAVGRLSDHEVAFLISRGAQVIPVEGGGHGSMFEDPATVQKISEILR